MIKKDLQIICEWNPTVTPKFRIVDFDEKEINALEQLFSDVKCLFAASIVNRHGLNWIELNWISLFKISFVIIKLHNSSHLVKVCLNNANRPKLKMVITIKKKNKDFKKNAWAKSK